MEFDYKTHIRRHEEKRKKEQEERDRRIKEAERLERTWELTRLCKIYIKENSPHWETNKELRDL